MADTLDIEEINRIRRAHGVAALPVNGASSGPVLKEASSDDSSDEEPASTLEIREAAGFENWKKLQDEQNTQARRKVLKEKIRKERDAAQRSAKLEGKGLGEDDSNDVDTKTYLKNWKKKQAEIAKVRKIEQELAEREKLVEYTSADLKGVHVGHTIDEIGEGDEHILTLKDTAVDKDSEDDELENLDLREKATLKEKLELKKKKPVYDPNTQDGQKSLLGQYDEVIDGKKQNRFTLDGLGSTTEASRHVDDEPKRKGVKISLDFFKDEAPVSDYKEPSEVKVKKPKKKKSKSTRKKTVDEDEDIFPVAPEADEDAMEVDSVAPAPTKKRTFDDFDDDEDLQAQLAQQRRSALKKRNKVRPEDLAQQIQEENSATPSAMEITEQNSDEEGERLGLVIDETSAFVNNLKPPEHEDEDEKRRQRRDPSPAPLRPAAYTRDEEHDEQDEEGDERNMSYAAIDSDGETRARSTSTPANEVTNTGLDAEETVSGGLGATVSMLSKRGLLHVRRDDDTNQRLRDRQQFLAKKADREAELERRAREQRERDRKSGRLDRMTAREREEYARIMNQQREADASRVTREIFEKEYKPNITLKYVDEHGRHMNEKEAFKHLSHQFHGKGSGKQKTEKYLKKIEDEKKRDAQSSLDSSVKMGMDNAAGMRAKGNRAAGVRLQ